jgi:hypothetical protein
MVCRFIAANTRPDHDTIATFRQRFLAQLTPLLLLLAREMGLLKLGKVSLDGTKIQDNVRGEESNQQRNPDRLPAQYNASFCRRRTAMK